MTRSILSILQTSIALAMVALFVSSAGSAGATPQRRLTDANAGGAEATCRAMGGSASTEATGVPSVEIDGHKGSHQTSTTRCSGGLLGGMTCDNYGGGRSDCAMSSTTGGGVRPSSAATVATVVTTAEISSDATSEQAREHPASGDPAPGDPAVPAVLGTGSDVDIEPTGDLESIAETAPSEPGQVGEPADSAVPAGEQADLAEGRVEVVAVGEEVTPSADAAPIVVDAIEPAAVEGSDLAVTDEDGA